MLFLCVFVISDEFNLCHSVPKKKEVEIGLTEQMNRNAKQKGTA